MGCRGCLQSMLKLTNFILATVGVAMIAYSIWMLNEWSQRNGLENLSLTSTTKMRVMFSPPPSKKILSEGATTVSSQIGSDDVSNHVDSVSLNRVPPPVHTPPHPATGPHVGLYTDDLKLPAPWFIYAFLIAGVFTVLVTCTGLLAAETNHGCCLSCYSLGLAVLLMGQATLAAIIFLDDTWEEDFPVDPTGEEEKAKAFVLTHLVVCQWTAISVLAVELFGLLLSLTLKAMHEGGRRGGGYDSDEEYALGSRSMIRQPLMSGRVHPGSLAPPQMGGPPQMGAAVGQANQGYRGLPRGPYGSERGGRGSM